MLLAQRLGLEARTEVRVAGRIRSAERGIDVVLTRLDTGQLRLVGLWLQVRVH